MAQTVIENPVLNSPFEEPLRHFKFSDEGITNEVVEARRISAYFIPIPRPRKRGAQLSLETVINYFGDEVLKILNIEGTSTKRTANQPAPKTEL